MGILEKSETSSVQRQGGSHGEKDIRARFLLVGGAGIGGAGGAYGGYERLLDDVWECKLHKNCSPGIPHATWASWRFAGVAGETNLGGLSECGIDARTIALDANNVTILAWL